MKAFVTGSTGLLGNNLVRALLAEGHEVVGLTRSAEKFDRMLGDTAATRVVGDITAIDGFVSALDSVDVVFHCAAYFREYFGKGDHAAQLDKINVDATLSLMREADDRGVGAFVHTSSSGTIGMKPDGSFGDEDTPADGKQLSNLYFKSKVDGDARIRAFAPPNGMRVLQVLPSWMFGPGDAGPTGAGQLILDFLAGKFPAVPEGGTSCVDARDVAAMMVRMVDQPHGERFIVSGPQRSLREVIDTVAEVTGRPAPKGNLPAWFAITYAWTAELVASLTGGRAAANLEGVRTMALKRGVDPSKAQRVLGLQVRPFAETIRDHVRWYVDHGMVELELPKRVVQPA